MISGKEWEKLSYPNALQILTAVVPSPKSEKALDDSVKFVSIARGYLDFQRLSILGQSMAFFIIRSKVNTTFGRFNPRTIDKNVG
jgi:hypothetical protein